MTSRQIGEVGIKLIGVYFAASAVHGVAGVLALLVGPQLEGFPGAGEMAIANSLPVLADVVVAAVCLAGGEAIARAVFFEHRFAISGPSRRDLLVTGVSLLGLSIALAGLPGVLQVIAVAVWYAEGSRQTLFAATMGRWWETLVSSGLAVLVGGMTTASAARIASVLEARYAGASGAGEPSR